MLVTLSVWVYRNEVNIASSANAPSANLNLFVSIKSLLKILFHTTEFITKKVYNVEDYIRQSIDSVLNQTYKNLEIILVDDGSKESNIGLSHFSPSNVVYI